MGAPEDTLAALEVAITNLVAATNKQTALSAQAQQAGVDLANARTALQKARKAHEDAIDALINPSAPTPTPSPVPAPAPSPSPLPVVVPATTAQPAASVTPQVNPAKA